MRGLTSAVLLMVFGALALLGGYFLFHETSPVEVPSSADNTKINVPEESQTLFSNKQYGFTFFYPDSFTVREDTGGVTEVEGRLASIYKFSPSDWENDSHWVKASFAVDRVPYEGPSISSYCLKTSEYARDVEAVTIGGRQFLSYQSAVDYPAQSSTRAFTLTTRTYAVVDNGSCYRLHVYIDRPAESGLTPDESAQVGEAVAVFEAVTKNIVESFRFVGATAGE